MLILLFSTSAVNTFLYLLVSCLLAIYCFVYGHITLSSAVESAKIDLTVSVVVDRTKQKIKNGYTYLAWSLIFLVFGPATLLYFIAHWLKKTTLLYITARKYLD